MKYCVSCGEKLYDNAAFCSKCGNKVGDNNGKQRDVRYAGSLIKCVNCGKELKYNELECPYCGYDIRDANITRAMNIFKIKMNSISHKYSSNNLSEKQLLERDREIARYIDSFFVPNDKENLITFINYSRRTEKDLILIYGNPYNKASEFSETKHEGDKLIAAAWDNMYRKTYNQAMSLFSSDSSFAVIKENHVIYEKTVARIKRKENFQRILNKKITINKHIKKNDNNNSLNLSLIIISAIGSILLLLLFFSPFIYLGYSEYQENKEQNRIEEELESRSIEIEEYIDNEEYDLAWREISNYN